MPNFFFFTMNYQKIIIYFAHIFFIYTILSVSNNAFAQLSVDNSMSDEELINSLAGGGVSLSNMYFDCPGGAYGSFNGADCNVGMAQGVMLTSGNIANAIGPNNSSGQTTANSTDGDADLENIPGVDATYDACALYVDITVASDTLVFNYIFGSEEYLEYVGSGFNDVFAFYITGPKPGGGNYNKQNIALIPGTNTAVSINNVNDQDYPQYYNENGDGFTTPYSTDNYYIQYDGFTTVLQARAAVIPCETYTLKLVVADAGDGVLDSGVFIEAGSLQTNDIELSASTSLQNEGFEYAVEGCVEGILKFTSNKPLVKDQVVYLEISGTAINGVDYQQIPDSIVFPAGDTVFYLNVNPIIDNTPEGLETVHIKITSAINCDTTLFDQALILIDDNITAKVEPQVVQICKGDAVQLIATGGKTYQWLPPDFLNTTNNDTVTATPAHAITYDIIAAVGPCKDTTQAQIIMDDNYNPTAITQFNACPGSPVQLLASGGTYYVWSPATNLSCSDCPNPTFTGSQDASYLLSILDTYGCSTDFTVNIALTGFSIPSDTFEVCPNSIFTNINLPTGNTYTWTPQTGLSCTNCPNPTVTVQGNEPITYTVTAQSGGSCNATATYTFLPQPLQANAGADIVVCNEPINSTLGTTSQPNLTYAWTPADSLSATNIAQPQVIVSQNFEQTYTLTVTNTAGCTATDAVLVKIETAPNITIPTPEIVPAGTPVTLNPQGLIGTETCLWTPDQYFVNSTSDCVPNLLPKATTNYTLTATTAGGCSSTASVQVTVLPPPTLIVPNSFSPNGDGMNDVLKVVARDLDQLKTFKIYNRWGQNVYTNPNDISQGWDGTFNNQLQPIGVYGYFVEYIEAGTLQPKMIKGNVTIIR